MSITTDSNSAIRDGRMGVFVLIAIAFLMGSYLVVQSNQSMEPSTKI